MKLRWMKALVPLLALGAIGLGAYVFVTMRPVEVVIVHLENDVAVRVFGLGTVEARIVSNIGFEVGAALVDLTVDHGDLVAKGDVLARLHSAEQEAKLARAEAGVLGAQVGIQKAEANAARARAVLAQRQEANRRQQALVGKDIVSAQTAEEAKRDEDVAAAELAIAERDIDVAKAQLADALAGRAHEASILDHHVLKAPFDAVIVQRHQELGNVIKAGDTIYTLMAPDTIWALAYVDEARAGAIIEGQEAEVRLRSLPQAAYKARVVRIGIESDRVNEERRVWLKCERCPPRVFLGEQAEVRITVAKLPTALLVPEVAVSGFDGLTGNVWVVRYGKLHLAQLTFGHRTEDARLEVTGGLAPDAMIVSAVVPGLREGRAARVGNGAGR